MVAGCGGGVIPLVSCEPLVDFAAWARGTTVSEPGEVVLVKLTVALDPVDRRAKRRMQDGIPHAYISLILFLFPLLCLLLARCVYVVVRR